MITDINVYSDYIICVCDDVIVRVPKVHYDRALMTLIHCSLKSLLRDFEGVILYDKLVI